MEPKEALAFLKNQVLALLSMLHISGPLWPKVDWKVMTRPSAPEDRISLAFLWAGARRWLWPIIRRLPLSLAAATMASHSSSETAIGFSHRTCLPAFSALMLISA